MSAPIRKIVSIVIPQTAPKAIGSVVFLHGSGDTGPGFVDYVSSILGVNQIQFPHLRLLFPTAPLRPYTPMMGNLSNVWYNREQISPRSPDDESVDMTAALLCELINAEVKEHGIPIQNIIVGGFSMGGAMAMQLAFRYYRDVAGVFAMSSFLGNQSLVYQALQTDQSAMPPLFQSHGEEDDLVHYQWGKDSFAKLQSLGVKGQFHSVPETVHVMDKGTLDKLCNWINEVLPQNSNL